MQYSIQYQKTINININSHSDLTKSNDVSLQINENNKYIAINDNIPTIFSKKLCDIFVYMLRTNKMYILLIQV